MNELVTLTDGVNEVNFLSGEGADTGFVKSNLEGLDPPPCAVRYASGRPVYRKWLNRDITITFGIKASSASDLATKQKTIITILENTYKYWATNGKEGLKAVFQYRRPGGTNTSYIDVYWGECDWGRVEQQAAAPYVYMLKGAQLTLTCEPCFHPSAVVALGPNEIKTPSFERDNNADGTADNWTGTGAPVLAMESTIVLNGCKSQKITTDAINEGILQTAIVAPAGTTEAVAYAWVCRPAAGSDIYVTLWDATAGANRGNALLSAGGWQTKVVGDNTWYRLVVSSSAIVAGNSHDLYIRALTATATVFYTDMAFWKWGTTTCPDEWIDYYIVYNHEDTGVNHVNHMGVAYLKGDLDAPCNIKITPAEEFSGADIDKFWVAMVGPKDNIKNWGEIDQSYDATRSNNSKWVTTIAASYSGWSTPSATYVISLTAAEWKAMAGRTWHILAGTYASQTTVKWRSKAMLRGWPSETTGVVIDTSAAISHPEASQWCLVDLGPLHISQNMAGDYSGDKLYIGWQASNPNGAQAVIQTDFLYLIPEHEYSLLIDKSAAALANYVFRATTDNLHINTVAGSYGPADFPHHVFTESYIGPENIGCLGSSMRGIYPRLVPSKDNRAYFIFAENSDRHNISRQFKVTIDYLPQYLVPMG